MDWTTVYEETGEEDLIIPLLLEEHSTAPRLARFVSHKYAFHEEEDAATLQVTHHRLFELFEQHQPPSSYTLQALYYLCINYILGVGCLGVPYAFARAGFLLCTAILLTVTVLSYMTVLWVAESGARLELLLQGEEERHDKPCERTSLVRRTSSSTIQHNHLDPERYEVVDLVSYYLGPIHKILYQVSLMALMYVGLLAYAQVFCGSIAALLWGHGNDGIAGLPQIIFAIMVVPLSCIELDEQVAVQSLMATVRFVALFVMIGGSLLALFIDSERQQERPPYFAPAEPNECRMSYTACFSGFGVAFSTALFSQLFQHSVPGLLRPLRDQPAKIVKAPKVFGASLLTTCSFYLLLGTSAASYFGAETQSSVNLNFSNFTFGFPPQETPLFFLLLLHFASSLVVMFPALDTISVFPLIANTLGNNLLAASGPALIKWIAHHLPHYYDAQDKKELLKRADKIATVFWRLVAALPPLVGSLWATDLSFSLLLAGVAGLYVAFFAPSLLQLASCRRMPQQDTIFDGWYSMPLLAYPVLVFATLSLVVVLLQIRDAVMTTG